MYRLFWSYGCYWFLQICLAAVLVNSALPPSDAGGDNSGQLLALAQGAVPLPEP